MNEQKFHEQHDDCFTNLAINRRNGHTGAKALLRSLNNMVINGNEQAKKILKTVKPATPRAGKYIKKSKRN